MMNITPQRYYIAAIIVGLAVGIALRDMPVGLLLAAVLVVAFATRRKK